MHTLKIGFIKCSLQILKWKQNCFEISPKPEQKWENFAFFLGKDIQLHRSPVKKKKDSVPLPANLAT